MRRLLTFIVLALGMLFPAAAFALPPAGVTGLTAEYSDGQVHVHWNPVESDGISFYRVYHSRRSILESGGQYDDFETVGGNLTNYILKSPPDSDALYVSVLAVNAQLEESDFFGEEVRVNLSEGDTVGATQQGAIPTPSPLRREREANTIGLVAAAQVSATEVQLTFSHDVILKPEQAQNAFQIMSISGVPLALRRLVIQGAIVRVTTDAQVRGETYGVSVSAVLNGESPAGAALPLDDTRSTAVFTAVAGVNQAPVAPPTASSSLPSSSAAAEASSSSLFAAAGTSDSSSSKPFELFPSMPTVTTGPKTEDSGPIRNVRLTVARDRGNLWAVTVRWDSILPPDVVQGYIVRAEREGKEISVPSGESSIVFSGVPGGTFSVSVRAVTADGESTKALASVTIDTTGGGTGSQWVVTRTGSRGNGLTGSGAGGSLALVAISGAAAAFKMRRRRAAASTPTF